MLMPPTRVVNHGNTSYLDGSVSRLFITQARLSDRNSKETKTGLPNMIAISIEVDEQDSVLTLRELKLL